jgi:hypothetical protein
MMKAFHKLLFLILASVFPALLFAQSIDAGAIGTIGVTKDIGRFMTANASQELRFNQNLTSFDRSLTSLGLDYDLIRKLLKAEIEYDFIYKNQIDYYEVRQRASLGLSTQVKFNSLNFKFRTKAQSTWRDETRGDYKFNPKYVWRNKLECTYTIFGSPVKPFVSGEVFCPLNGSNGFFLDGYRAIAGAKYRTSAHTTLEFQVRFDQEIQQASPKSIFYGGIGWYYDL